MIGPLELGIGLRYLRAQKRSQFVSYITLASMLGVAIGVAALIVILSVMNGFENELRSRLLSLSAHVSVRNETGEFQDWQQVMQTAQNTNGVRAAGPFIAIDAMIRGESDLHPVLVEGVDPSIEERGVSEIAANMLLGDFQNLKTGAQTLVLGRILALKLGVALGDDVVLLLPRPNGTTVVPELRRFTVAGVFEAGIQDHDASLVLINLNDAMSVLGDRSVTGVRMRVDDVFAAPKISAELLGKLGSNYTTSDWTVENANYFRAVRLEKTMMSVILSLVIAVAAFNIVASLVMVVTDKESAIAVLRTLGMKPASVVRIFAVQGLTIGWIGAGLGVVLGIVLSLNVSTIVPFFEQVFHFKIMPGDVYYVTDIPSDLQLTDVLWVALVAFGLTGIATIYPSRRAASVHPAEALRYE